MGDMMKVVGISVRLQTSCKYGIIVQYIIPGTPKQNGVIERRNQTLMNIVRSVISISSLPISLWGDDLKTIAHILNHDSW